MNNKEQIEKKSKNKIKNVKKSKKCKTEEENDSSMNIEGDIEEVDDSMSQKTVRSNRGKKKTYATKLERKKRKIAMLAKNREQKKTEYTAEKKEKASQISVERILTDEDFKRIDMALVKQQVTHAKRGVKRPHDEDRGELVKLGDIENIYKKKRHDKEARQETVRVIIFNNYILLHK